MHGTHDDEPTYAGRGELLEGIVVGRDAQRPATILRVAGELESRGGRILELFKEISSPAGKTVLPIHLDFEGRGYLIEVRTEAWDDDAVASALRSLTVVRNSELADLELALLCAYPAPEPVAAVFGSSPSALLQADLMDGDPNDPQGFAETFRAAASRRWDVELDYSPGALPLAEELLLAALESEGPRTPILNELVEGLGAYVGEVIRRSAPVPASWTRDPDGPVLDLEAFIVDPMGKARAFVQNGAEDSVAFFADYVLEEVGRETGG